MEDGEEELEMEIPKPSQQKTPQNSEDEGTMPQEHLITLQRLASKRHSNRGLGHKDEVQLPEEHLTALEKWANLHPSRRLALLRALAQLQLSIHDIKAEEASTTEP